MDRGKGGWLSYFQNDELVLAWDGTAGPEKKLDEGYTVIQCLRPFTSVGTWGDWGEAGGTESKKGALP